MDKYIFVLTHDLPKVSVIILNYQGKDIIENCIKSVINNSYKNIEIILIDNNSTDGSFEIAYTLLNGYENKIIIKNEKNLGFTRGYNIGMAHASGELFLLLNNDIILDNYSIQNYVKFFESNKNIGLAEGRIINKLPDIYDFTSNPNIVSIFGLLHEESSPKEDGTQYSKITRMYSPIGVWPMFRKDVYDIIGGYDEDFFMVEEIRDLAARVWIAGYEVGYVYDAVVYHIGRLTGVKKNYSNNISDILLFHATKNSVIFYLKNYQLKTQIKYIIPYSILQITNAFLSLTTSGRKDFKIKMRAYGYILKNYKKIRDKRKAVNKLRRVDDKKALETLIPINFNNLRYVFNSQKNFKKYRKPTKKEEI